MVKEMPATGDRSEGESGQVMSPEEKEKILQLLDLEDNWDSYGARRPDPRAVAKAVQVALCLGDIAPFVIVPMTNGGISLEASEGGLDFDFEIVPTGIDS